MIDKEWLKNIVVWKRISNFRIWLEKLEEKLRDNFSRFKHSRLPLINTDFSASFSVLLGRWSRKINKLSLVIVSNLVPYGWGFLSIKIKCGLNRSRWTIVSSMQMVLLNPHSPTEDSMCRSRTTRVAPRARATDEDQLVRLEKEQVEARSTIEEKERSLKAQAERISQLEGPSRKRWVRIRNQTNTQKAE